MEQVEFLLLDLRHAKMTVPYFSQRLQGKRRYSTHKYLAKDPMVLEI
jgi:hypothetical protein